jgi:hypothetical protein
MNITLLCTSTTASFNPLAFGDVLYMTPSPHYLQVFVFLTICTKLHYRVDESLNF